MAEEGSKERPSRLAGRQTISSASTCADSPKSRPCIARHNNEWTQHLGYVAGELKGSNSEEWSNVRNERLFG